MINTTGAWCNARLKQVLLEIARHKKLAHCRNEQILLFHTRQRVYWDSVWLLPLSYPHTGRRKGIGSIHQLQSTGNCYRLSTEVVLWNLSWYVPWVLMAWSTLLDHCGNNAVSFPRCFAVRHNFAHVGVRKGQVFRSYEMQQSGYSRVAQISVWFF